MRVKIKIKTKFESFAFQLNSLCSCGWSSGSSSNRRAGGSVSGSICPQALNETQNSIFILIKSVCVYVQMGDERQIVKGCLNAVRSRPSSHAKALI